jgi:phenylacetate-CoA ligase
VPDQVKSLQEKKLAHLVRHAYHHVPYYRRLLDEHDIRPEDIRTIDDLRRMPLLSKGSVREHLYLGLLSDNHDKRQILKITTSGSTGEPFVCFADRHQLEIRWAATLRGLEWTGYRFGDRQVRLWHQTLGMTRLQVLREKIDAWLNRRLFIPAFEMSGRNLDAILQRIRAHRPVLIDGYAESFNLLAQYLSACRLNGMGPKAIMSSAQVLPDHTRKAIEEAFRCEVFDKYGSREFSGIAYECDVHEGHHVSAESYIVEIVKDGRPARPGEIGEVVITDLNNYCMPFLRYRIGDLAEAMDDGVPCRCGRGLPRIGAIQGRVQSIIVGSNGNYVPGSFFGHLFKDYGHVVQQYRIVQYQPGEIDLSIVRGSRFNDELFQEVLSALKSYLGVHTKINVELVDEIPLETTGKRQAAVSYVQFDFQKLDSALSAQPERATR